MRKFKHSSFLVLLTSISLFALILAGCSGTADTDSDLLTPGDDHAAHDHGDHDHKDDHDGHDHGHKGHEHDHEGHDHAGHDHEHGNEGHKHDHEGHDHEHGNEGHDHDHEGHDHAGHDHDHGNEGHDRGHGDHEHGDHGHAGHDHWEGPDSLDRPVRIQPGTHLVYGGGHDHGDAYNPLTGFGAEGASKIFNGLITYDADLNMIPDLAVKLPTISKDGKTVTVTIKDDVLFHDGTTLDGEDVKATFTALADPKTGSPLAGNYSMVKDISVTKDYVITFTLDKPFSAFLHQLAVPIVPSELIDLKKSVYEMPIATKLIGTGPYKVASYVPGKEMNLEAFQFYFGETAHIQKVTVLDGADANSLANQLAQGKVNIAQLPGKIAKSITDKSDDLTLIANPSMDYRGIVLPMKNPVTGDIAIRLAMNHAVNRDGLQKAFLHGFGTPAYTPIPANNKKWGNSKASFTYDINKAKSLLDKAGWTVANNIKLSSPKKGIRANKEGVQAEFDLMVPASDPLRKELALGFASDMKKIGIHVNVEALGWDAIEPRMAKDAVLFANGTPFSPMITMVRDLHSQHAYDGFNNPGGYKNKKVDKLLDVATTAVEVQKQQQAIKDIQTELIKDPPAVYLTFVDHTYVADKTFTGNPTITEPHAHGFTWGPLWNLAEWKEKP